VYTAVMEFERSQLGQC